MINLVFYKRWVFRTWTQRFLIDVVNEFSFYFLVFIRDSLCLWTLNCWGIVECWVRWDCLDQWFWFWFDCFKKAFLFGCEIEVFIPSILLNLIFWEGIRTKWWCNISKRWTTLLNLLLLRLYFRNLSLLFNLFFNWLYFWNILILQINWTVFNFFHRFWRTSRFR